MKKEKTHMAEKNELVLDDFTDVTDYIFKALEKINTLFASSSLTEEEKSKLGRLGRSIHSASHEMDHLFLSLESVPNELKKALQAHYGH
ncbi:MAG: hypothetical protein JW883_15520 [Deltaproteobacteria bacterium]|nr:hypothetical protein [Deltaproteobacteria bacterium]